MLHQFNRPVRFCWYGRSDVSSTSAHGIFEMFKYSVRRCFLVKNYAMAFPHLIKSAILVDLRKAGTFSGPLPYTKAIACQAHHVFTVTFTLCCDKGQSDPLLYCLSLALNDSDSSIGFNDVSHSSSFLCLGLIFYKTTYLLQSIHGTKYLSSIINILYL